MRCVCIKEIKEILPFELKESYEYEYDDYLDVHIVISTKHPVHKYPIPKNIFNKHFIKEDVYITLIREGKLKGLLT